MPYTKRLSINRGYLKLEAWSRAQDLVKLTKEILDRSPGIGFKLRDQVMDAVTSIAANIAEGYCRRSIKEYIQFCYISLGSAGETLSRMISLLVSVLVTPADFERFDALHSEVENRLTALVRSLERKRDAGTWEDSMP